MLERVHGPATSALVLQIYDSPHNNLVLLVNAAPEEEAAIGEELGVMGCRTLGPRIVAFETGRKDRYVHAL